ncbi:arylsulfatase J-like [Mercenaria mercenaria]|uniref:arylsulfatase J-like n=1 Tax=Mercenaria mercenaria TaxID=6596 RepID=UPI001E1D5BFD|nr:arylsulfatase J-like [Mercenaria mercenaria]
MRNKRVLLLVMTFLTCKCLIEMITIRAKTSEAVHGDVLKLVRDLKGNRSAPHILFIIADDLGFNDVGYHGSEIKTPNLDTLATTGVRLENYYVQPICTPTRGQLLTGRYQIHTGLHWVLWPATPTGLSLDNPTIADKLREAGYATHMVGKWHLGFYKADYLPTRRGFDTYFGFLSGHSDYYTHVTGNYQEKVMIGYDLMENDKPANISKYNGTYSTHLFGSKVKDIINGHDLKKPMFIYLSFQAVHAPLQVPYKYLRQYSQIKDAKRRQYAGMVTCMDETIGDIVEAMKKRRMWENTLLIFSTDNGGNPNVGGSNLPLKGTKSTLWEGGIRAVGFVHSFLIGHKRNGYVSNELMHVTDWFPTLVNLAGGDLKDNKQLDGYDQWQTIKYGIRSQRQEILHNIDPLYNNTYYTRRSSIRIGAWKIIIGQLGPDSRKKQSTDLDNVCLFNIESDPFEQKDLSEQFPQIVENMLQRLEEYDKGSVSCQIPRVDSRANPAYHDGFWQPWQ